MGHREYRSVSLFDPALLRAMRRIGRIVALFAWALAGVAHAQASEPNPTEYQVKAAYLYNFGRFVEWPPAGESDFVICVLGEDPFGGALDRILTGEHIAGRRAVARRISGFAEVRSCRVLFISSSEADRLDRILDSLGGASVLTVSEAPSFVRRGGMIQFVLDGSKVRFAVDSRSAQNAGLKLSSELLKLAVSARTAP